MKKNDCSKTSFRSYLQGKGYSGSTIAGYERFTGQFTEWMKKEQLEAVQVRYADVLGYMKHCSIKKGYSQKTVQHAVITLRHYFDWLQQAGQTLHNPAKGIRVQGVKRKVLHHILEPQELHAVYHHYQGRTLSEKKNKVVIGLLVYQGLRTEELDKIETADVRLKEGEIEIREGRRSDGRTLRLESHQVLDLYEYVMKVRPQILATTKQQTDKLLVNVEGGKKVRTDFLMKKIRQQNPKVRNTDQIRASVIVKWLKQYNLRQVQYLAGHRYISSTEAYRHSEMEGLSEEVNRYHPLG